MAKIGQSQPPLTFELLAIGLRTRAATVSELSALSLLDESAVRAQLALLADQHFVSLEGDQIQYREPDAVLTETATGILANLVSEASAQISEVNDLVRAIPALMHNWSVGSEDSPGLRSEMFHGPFAPTDLWLRQASIRRLQKTDGVLPDATRIFDADPQAQRVWFEAVSDPQHRVRTLLRASDLTHPRALAIIEADAAVGAEFRMLASPPSWFWISDDVVAGIPLEWGQAWPTSVMAVYSRPVITLLRWLYDRLWSEAIPVLGAEHTWDPLLALMTQGATLEVASNALGISSRTGRRRLSDAMDHFGVDGAVALGAAWQRDRSAVAGATHFLPDPW